MPITEPHPEIPSATDMPPRVMPLVHIYCRIRHGESPGDQRKVAEGYIRDHLSSRGLLLGQVFEDRSSAGKHPLGNRPAGFQLLAELGAGDHVVTSASAVFSAGTKSASETLSSLVTRGAVVHFHDLGVSSDSEDGRMLRHWLDVFQTISASWWRERRRETVSRQRRKGKSIGGPAPYGFRHAGKFGDRRLVPDTHTRAIGRLIVRMRDQGHTWEGVYHFLLAQGVRTRGGREVSYGSMQRFFHAEQRLQTEEAAAKVASSVPTEESKHE